MQPHPYLRAYLAGIAVPTPLLLVAMMAFIFFRYILNVPIPIERAIVFPMAVVPNAWGLWNILPLALQSRFRISLGIHGALLAVLLVPGGVLLIHLLDISGLPPAIIGLGAPFALIIYYLLWKHLVGYLNHVLGIA